MGNGILSIYKKEIKDSFYSAIAYIFLVIFILLSNILFFNFMGGIFKENQATLRRFFATLPFIFIFFIPGLTMGVWSKEKDSGTIELLFTLPLRQSDILFGKYLAAMTLVFFALFLTLPIPILTQFLMGSFDWGQLLTQYIGSLLMASCFIAITFFISSLTKELIISFLIAVFLLLVLTFIGFVAQTADFYSGLEWLKVVFNKISLYSRFLNFSKGVIDTRDVIYYLGVTFIFFYLNLRSLESR